MNDQFVRSMAELIRSTEPAPLDSAARAQIIAAAMQAAPEPQQARTILPRWAFAAAVLLAFASVLAGYWSRETPQSVATTFMRMTLPTGDRLTMTPSSEFKLVSATKEERHLILDRGSVLFDVTPLSPAETFTLETRHARVAVVGTIFSVETSADQTSVHVFEGKVSVSNKGAIIYVAAGASWTSNGAVSALAPTIPFYAAGNAAGAKRLAAKRLASVKAPTPSIARVPQTVPATTPPLAQGTHPLRQTYPSPRAVPVSEHELSLAAAEELVRKGKYEQVITVARRQQRRTTGVERGDWFAIEGDALRALQRYEEAAKQYDQAARLLRRTPRGARVGFAAATIHYNDLRSATAALRSLDAAEADQDNSIVEERALALRVRCLVELGSRAEARTVAHRYLARFPSTALADWMTTVADE